MYKKTFLIHSLFITAILIEKHTIVGTYQLHSVNRKLLTAVTFTIIITYLPTHINSDDFSKL